MVKVKIFGVLRTTIGVGSLETDARDMVRVFEELSAIMKERYALDQENLAKMQNDPDVKIIKKRNQALEPHEQITFGEAVVYVNGTRCLKKKMKLSDGDEIWLLSPAAGG